MGRDAGRAAEAREFLLSDGCMALCGGLNMSEVAARQLTADLAEGKRKIRYFEWGRIDSD
jgi:hypothetical protein